LKLFSFSFFSFFGWPIITIYINLFVKVQIASRQSIMEDAHQKRLQWWWGEEQGSLLDLLACLQHFG
jgi:hypothetical protein